MPKTQTARFAWTTSRLAMLEGMTAEIVQRLRRIARRSHSTESLRDVMAAEVMLDRLLARRRGAEAPLFGEDA